MKRRGLLAGLLTTVLVLTGVSAAEAVSPIPHGCAANGKALPTAEANNLITRKTVDIDGDGKADTLFHYEAPDSWGVKTATGAVMVVRTAPLTSGGDFHSWGFHPEAGPGVMMLDDGHFAYPYYLIQTATGCHFRAPDNAQGKQFSFSLYGYGKYGTGVGCLGSDRGGYNIYGRNAVKVGTRYRVDNTLVRPTDDGKVMRTYGAKTTGKTYSTNDGRIGRARLSICTQAPEMVVYTGENPTPGR